MGEIIIENDVAISLGSIDGEEDLKVKPGLINIKPPPPDGKCMCCGRHMSELRPFGKARDPLMGDFDGALLVKNFRTALPPADAETWSIYKRFFRKCKSPSDYDKALENLIKECGERSVKTIMSKIETGSQVGPSWECRDCAVLNIYEYFEKLGYDLDEYFAWKQGQKDEGKATDVQE